MIRSSVVAVTVALLFFLPVVGFAQEGTAKQLAVLKTYLGKWACDNKTLGEGGHAFKATWELTEDLPNVLVARWTEVESKEHPQAGKELQVYWFDPKSKHYTRVMSNPAGSSIWTLPEAEQIPAEKAPGSLVWKTDVIRNPVSIKTPNEFWWSAEIQDGEKWTKVAEGTCKR